MERQLVISDIHGCYKALIQVLDRCEFDKDNDQLIFLGDVCDGYNYVTECIQHLSEIPNLIQIMGNHDDWCYRWLGQRLGYNSWGLNSETYRCWFSQGGESTINSMRKNESHQLVYDFLNKSKPSHVDNHNVFIHAGMNPKMKVEDCDPTSLMWDRELIDLVRLESISRESDPIVTGYDECYIGHTPVISYNVFEPTQWSNVIACDCGCSYPTHGGRLGVIDVKTKECWVSDKAIDLYPNEKAR